MNQLSKDESYLVLDYDKTKQLHRVRVVCKLGEALRSWRALTRISPILPIKSDGRPIKTSFNFPNTSYLCFLGPAHPIRAISISPKSAPIWQSFGVFNTIVLCQTITQVKALTASADRDGISWETWKVKKGELAEFKYSDNANGSEFDLNSLGDFYEQHHPNEIRQALGEYCPLLASTLARSSVLTTVMTEEIQQIHKATAFALKPKGTNLTPMQALAHLTVLNAGLSRFSSQTFSGASPIIETECHFWLHSLLGIGLPNLALRNIRASIQSTLGAAALPAYLVTLAEVKDKFPDLTRSWIPDDLRKILPKLNKTTVSTVPLLTFFSGREGYSASNTTISAPLAAISACNSKRWSLLTMTHELLHVVVRSILAKLCGDANDKANCEKLHALFHSRTPADNLFDEIRRLFIVAAVRAAHGESVDINTVTSTTIIIAIDSMYHDIEEVMVHALDFMYFYGGDTDRYVSGIWTTWGIIPDVRMRLDEYIVRTLCAVLTNHWSKSNRLDQSKSDVTRILSDLLAKNANYTHVKEALELLEQKWDTDLKHRMHSLTQFVKLVSGVFYDLDLATEVRTEIGLTSSSKRGRTYSFVPDTLEFASITNPLMFIEQFSTDNSESTSRSLWIYLVLAYGINQDEP